MEMLRGSDLARVIREQGALDPASTVEVFVQIARALTVAHERGIVHRDIKPANIFLHVGDDGSVTAKLCDFGVAKASEEVESTSDRGPALTQTGGFLGSPMYMSPEQAQNAKGSTPQSDVWSLGASLYEALSGRRLWEDSLSVGAVIFAICTAPIVPLRSHATWLPEGLEVAVSKSLERDLAKRWPTAEAFATALLPFMRGNTDETLRPLRLDDLSRKRGADHGSSAPHASGSADTALSWPPGQTPAGNDRPAAAASGSRSPSTAPVQTLSVADFEPERRAGVWIPWAIGGGVLVTLGGLAFMFAAPTVTPAAPTAATSPTASPTDGATAGGASASAGVSPAEGERGTNPGGKSAAKITILPKTAVVTVDGAARRPQGGVISLEGEPGDAFEIKASSGGTSATCKAVFLKDGTASIKTVDATKGSCE
jgi:serine/threonine-protein kinase